MAGESSSQGARGAEKPRKSLDFFQGVKRVLSFKKKSKSTKGSITSPEVPPPVPDIPVIATPKYVYLLAIETALNTNGYYTGMNRLLFPPPLQGLNPGRIEDPLDHHLLSSLPPNELQNCSKSMAWRLLQQYCHDRTSLRLNVSTKKFECVFIARAIGVILLMVPTRFV